MGCKLTSGGGSCIFALLGKYDIMSRGQIEHITLSPVIYVEKKISYMTCW